MNLPMSLRSDPNEEHGEAMVPGMHGTMVRLWISSVPWSLMGQARDMFVSVPIGRYGFMELIRRNDVRGIYVSVTDPAYVLLANHDDELTFERVYVINVIDLDWYLTECCRPCGELDLQKEDWRLEGF